MFGAPLIVPAVGPGLLWSPRFPILLPAKCSPYLPIAHATTPRVASRYFFCTVIIGTSPVKPNLSSPGHSSPALFGPWLIPGHAEYKYAYA